MRIMSTFTGISAGPGAAPAPTPTTGADLPPAVARALSRSADWISSWWTVWALAAATLAMVAWLIVRRRAHRRRRCEGRTDRVARPWVRRAVTAGGVLGVVVLFLATGLIGANAYSGYVPGVAALAPTLQGWGVIEGSTSRWNPKETVGDATHGSVQTVDIPAKEAERMSGGPAWVYTPPGYDPAGGGRYPVVYLIHGSPGRPSDFFAAADGAHAMDALIRHRVVPPMILVSIDVNGTGRSARDTECLDSTTGGSLVESYVTGSVIAWVDSHLPTIPDRTARVIGGASSGGFCALNLGLRHTDLYSGILALMPYGEPGAGGDAMLASQAEIDANTPAHYLPTMDFAGPVDVFFDTGAGAGSAARAEGRTLAQMLVDRGQRVELREEAGQGHTWSMVNVGLPYAFRFAGTVVGHDSRRIDEPTSTATP